MFLCSRVKSFPTSLLRRKLSDIGKSVEGLVGIQYFPFMSIHQKITRQGIYFITFTNHVWFPLIQLTNGYDSVYNWFTILKKKGHILTGFVIMPNHLHILLYYAGVGHFVLLTTSPSSEITEVS